ncbi:BCCT family transporter [Treponema phagedenis]|uniref:BCCT family transporter n=1 Tax=Treponema phagedenis TaxID=162 RepID=UPI0001F63CEC|nr:BCCT family transporter [Treponema phagedenis]EFW37576.1 transporter, betaine/carnitine/choline family [Treponema phagedenis F0421]TYT79233.1 BCCT family transporter [Treponema phagedenis]
MKETGQKKQNEIDWFITIAPLAVIILVSLLLIVFPTGAKGIIDRLWSLFVNELGFFYILIGLGFVIVSIVLAFSKYGNIRLGTLEKPRYSNFAWGSMIFTSTMAADILYWSLIEWAYYFTSTPFAKQGMTLAEKQDWASAYPLFHWGITPWAFYILPAVAFAYMLHVKGGTKQKLSEACRPILGKRIDGVLGHIIDIFSVVGLLAGTATTFSLATPLLSLAVSRLFGIPESRILTLIILFIIALVYTSAVLLGIKGISKLAGISVICFSALLAFFFLAGPKIYLIETGISGIGKMVQNFFSMSTWMDPLRLSGDGGNGFPQNWTIFYWAYWIAWSVATPFFIGSISEGRTVRNTILGGLACGIAGTYCSFIILGNYGLYLETHGIVSAADMLAQGAVPSVVIMHILTTLPFAKVGFVIFILTMIALYASTFDAITLVIASYSQRQLKKDEEPHKALRAFWAIVFILLPAAFIFVESTLNQLQSLSIIAAFPLGIIMIIIVTGFFKEVRKNNEHVQDVSP